MFFKKAWRSFTWLILLRSVHKTFKSRETGIYKANTAERVPLVPGMLSGKSRLKEEEKGQKGFYDFSFKPKSSQLTSLSASSVHLQWAASLRSCWGLRSLPLRRSWHLGCINCSICRLYFYSHQPPWADGVYVFNIINTSKILWVEGGGLRGWADVQRKLTRIP